MKNKIVIYTPKIVLIVLFFLLLNACENKKIQTKVSKETEIVIIKKCLNRLYQNGSKENYLVSPRYDSFGFNVFLRENKIKLGFLNPYDYDKNKPKILQTLNWNYISFNKMQLETNKKYLDKSNSLLLKLSNSDISQTVISFSGIHENLVFADVIVYCDSIKSSDLASSSFNKKQKFYSASSIIFVLKNGKVESMTFDGGGIIEGDCNR